MLETYMIKQIAAFANENTLSGVAERLHVSQPAVSRAMKKLERIIGVPLFERTKNSIRLNSFGMLAARHAGIILSAQEEMLRAVRDEHRRSRTFSYGAIAPAPAWELSPILSQMYPGMTVSYELQEKEEPLLKGLDEKRYDIVVLLNPAKGKNYFCRPFIRERLSVMLPKKHRLATRKAIWLKDLAGEKILIHDKIGFWYSMVRRKIPGAVFLEQPELASLLEIVKNSHLPSFITDISEQKLHTPVPKDKTAILLLDEEASARFYCVCRTEDANSLAAVFSAIDNLIGRK
ncbi:MAG: LysR family transcriptional regulator [Elusimicrobiales bacterium]|nr:LysR family transcriptional regulator [Elusimicrobiales bacterium]